MAGLEHALRPVTVVRHAMRACLARPRLSLAVWGIVIALLASGVGVLWWQDHRHDQAEAAGTAAVTAVEENLSAILSYTSASVDADLAAARAYLTGGFQDDFGQLAEGLVGPAAKRDGISTTAKVVATSVVSATATDVVALAYVNQSTTSKALAEPRADVSRLRVALTLVDDRWLVSDLKPI